jgi:hypothetical protein
MILVFENEPGWQVRPGGANLRVGMSMLERKSSEHTFLCIVKLCKTSHWKQLTVIAARKNGMRTLK